MQIQKGISPQIDSCAGLIAQQALRFYRRVAPEHQRWIDPEDLLQEALLEAVRAERKGRYQKNRGTKFSTYLYTGLFFDLSKTYADRLRVQKRSSKGVLELDAPRSEDDDRYLEIPDREAVPGERRERLRRAIFGLLAFCRAITPQQRVTVVKVLLCGKRASAADLADLKSTASVAARIGAKWDDFSVLTEAKKSRKMALIQLLSSGILSHEESDARVLECIGCSGQFTLGDVREGRYIVSTSTCRICYRELQRSAGSCFGKPKTEEREGYSENDVECRLHCQDRKVCRQFVNTQEKDKMATKKNDAEAQAEQELAEVTFDETEEEEAPKPKKAAKKVKAAAPAAEEKPKAAKKAASKKEEAEEDDDPAPAEVGKWPFKGGNPPSWMRYLWQSAYAGLKLKDFEAMLKAAGRSSEMEKWKNWLRKGKNGLKTGNPTHTWKLNEEGGQLKIYAVKYHGPRERAERTESKPKGKAKAAKKAA